MYTQVAEYRTGLERTKPYDALEKEDLEYQIRQFKSLEQRLDTKIRDLTALTPTRYEELQAKQMFLGDRNKLVPAEQRLLEFTEDVMFGNYKEVTWQ